MTSWPSGTSLEGSAGRRIARAQSGDARREAYGDAIVRARDDIFVNLPLTAQQRERLMKLTLDSWYKQPVRGETGVLAARDRRRCFPRW